METPFPCTRCGACCRLIGRSVGYYRTYDRSNLQAPGLDYYDFPYKITPAGACEKYDPQIGCTVYNNRPEICNFTRFHKKYLPQLTVLEFHKMIAAQCNQQIDELKIDHSLQPKL